MRIWLDILTPKQVMFFKPAVEKMKDLGHEVLCTSRNYRECIQLATIRNLDVKIIGKHGGIKKYDKLRASAERIFELSEEILNFLPDVAISFSSPEAARVAFGLGIKKITFNDSPHAKAVAKLTLPLTELLLCPWVIPYPSWYQFGITRSQIYRYHALDPAAWLKNKDLIPKDNSFDKKFNFSKSNTILIRPEESEASYINLKDTQNSNVLIDRVVNSFYNSSNIIILSRYEDQIKHFSYRYEKKALVMKETIGGLELISICDIFIGAGGTMSAEAALLGKPVISIAPIKFFIDDYLVKSGLVKKITRSDVLVKLISKIQQDPSSILSQRKLAKKILSSMEDPTIKLLDILEK